MRKLTLRVALGAVACLGFTTTAVQADNHTCADATFAPVIYERWPHADDACLEIVTREDGMKYARFEAEVVSQSPSGTYVRYTLQDGSKTPSRKVNPPEGFEAMIAGRGVGGSRGEVFRALIDDDLVVGWLGLSAPVWLEDQLAQRFNRQHNRSLLWISLAALALAMVLGAILGTAMLRRIRAVAAGARQLAKGDYQARVVLKGRDELTELAEDFNQLALTLERSEALRRGAMADVSHELRTPLAVARAELDALIDGIRPCSKERLEQLHGRLLTLGRLLDDLYDLALSDSGALNYRFEPLDLSAILRSAIADREADCVNISMRRSCALTRATTSRGAKGLQT